MTHFETVVHSTFNYDDSDQLTGADYNYQTDENYTYDANGNRANTGYVTGINNRLLEDSKYRYEYDKVGNRTKRTDKSIEALFGKKKKVINKGKNVNSKIKRYEISIEME